MSATNELVITFKGDTSDALSKTNGLKSALGGLGDLAGGALKVGLIGATAGIAALGAGLAASVAAAMEAEEGQAALAAVLASTHGKAGMTADAVNALASSLQDVTRFEDDTILSGENMLLTFTNIGKDVFPAATETMLNMAQAMGGDVKGAAIQLGKALNDPTQGMTALTRVGVTFTDAQKEQIKALQESGDLMGAQKIILAELETEFGGAARAAGDTFAGKLDILNHKFGDIMESVGGALIPILTAGADALIAFMANPAIQAGLESLQRGIGFVVDAVKGLADGLSSGDIIGGITMFIGEMGMAFGMAEDSAFEFADGVIAAIQSIFSGVGSGENPLSGLIEGLQSNFQGLMDWLTGELGPALAESFAAIAEAALPTLQLFGEWITGALIPALQSLWNWLSPMLGAAFSALGTKIVTELIPQLTALIVFIVGKVLPTFGQWVNDVGGRFNKSIAEAGQLWGQLSKGFQDSVKFVDDIKKTLDELASALKTNVADAFLWFKDNVLQPIQEALAALASYIQKVLDMLNKLGGWGGAPMPNTGGGTYGGQNFAGGGGRGTQFVNVNLNYAPTVSLMDQAEAQTKLNPFVREAVREALGLV